MSARTLSGKAAIAGIGATEFSKESGRSELQLSVEAVRHALDDCGLTPADVDGLVDQMRDDVEAARRRVLQRTPLGRFGEPEEIGRVAVFLACEDSSYMTGQTLYPDGGRLALNYTVPL